MDKNTSHKIIKDTLEGTFDRNKFLLFAKNLCNQIDESKAFQLSGAYIPDAFRGYIKSYERLGTFTDPEDKKIDVLIVYLQKDTSLERARTAQRNFVARYLKDRDQKDAGLVAFVSPNSEDWRFSLIKMEYKFTEGKSGKVKVKEEFTPARRWSFLVGANENSHTAQSRLAPILQDDEHNPTTSVLEECFNIEKVTKEFFEKYRDLFLRVKETLDDIIEKDSAIRKDFDSKGVDTVDFSKKLLGQIVFLYFLQKKGWFGVERDCGWGSGPKNFLRQLFEQKHGAYKNFFNDILEPLFYEALALERDDDFYSRFNCKIPFLNGGLFDPLNNYDWVHTDVLLPNDLFSNNERTKEGDIGDGILDVFDRYNFTVKEDEPLEKEVAIDPETLGKVFENLLEVKDRKSKGTYYTPREIVHYMCVQSLIGYLTTELNGKVSREDLEKLIMYGETVGENEARVEEKGEETQTYHYKMPESVRINAKLIDEKLSNIKVCDPAIGSGAFPVGMMTEIVRARNTLSIYLKDSDRTLYNFKRDCIQNSLYGVDIDPGAVEIAKLRLWLSLVVDEDDIKQIKPLPNLDYKIMQGNSLLEEFEGIRLFDEKLISAVNFDKEKQIEELKEKQNILSGEYIKLHQANKLTDVRKEEIDTELKKIVSQIKRLSQSDKAAADNPGLFDIYSNAKKKADELKRLHKEFFETTQKKKKDDLKKQIERLEWDLIEATLKEKDKNSELKKLEEFKRANTKPFFLWKLHFSEVFQNGGFDVVIANPPYVGQKGNKDLFEQMKEDPNFEKKMDYWYFFLHKAHGISNKGGITSFITTNYWITAQGGKKIRDKITNHFKFIEFINFNENKIFVAGVHTNILILQKEKPSNNIIKCCMFQNIYNENIFDSREKELNFVINQSLILSKWTGFVHFLPENISGLINKLMNNSIKLSDNESQGEKKSNGTPGKKVTDGICNINQGIITGKDRYKNNNGEINEGVYVLNGVEVKNLKLSKIEYKVLNYFVKNSDIEKYHINNSDNYLLYIDQIETEKALLGYKNIYTHIKKYKEILKDRYINGVLESAYKKGKWWALIHTVPFDIIKKEKIICPQRSNANTFAYTKGELYASADVYYISLNKDNYSLKYILSILNSKLIYFWLYWMGKRKGELLELYFEPLQFVPIKIVDNYIQKPLIELVDKILAITKSSDYLENPAKQSKVKECERQIDQMVYKLYGLTPEEIKIVEFNK